MSARFTLFHSGADLVRLFGEAARAVPEAGYNIGPPGPVWAMAGPPSAELRAGWMHWGYELQGGDGREVINARAETAHQKPLFREDWLRRRCVLPVSGFYEWGGEGLQRRPWLFLAKDGSPMAMAALWRYSRADGKPQCVVLTREAAAPVAEVHERMPVLIADPRSLREWLTAGLLPDEMPALEARPVSRRVNRRQAQGPELIQPVTDEDLFRSDPPGAERDEG
jgi:putative SOS response-associated peptidase YedK